MKKTNKKLKIGLALGGGGARGLSHIGILKVFEENGIKIDYIAGTSIGAMIGAFYAYSENAKEIENLALQTNWKKVVSLIDPSIHQGILNGDKVKKYIKNFIGKNTKFSDLKIPFSAVATNLKTGKPVVLKKGNVASAVRASISFPLIFRPVKLKGKILSDGGLCMPIPVEVVKNMGADFVIAVNLDGDYKTLNKSNQFGFTQIADSSINILKYYLANSNAKYADFVFIPKVGRFGLSQFLRAKEIIKEGEKTAKNQIKSLKKALNT